MKTIKHPILKGKPPKRCINIIRKNQAALDNIKSQDKMRLLNKFGYVIEDKDKNENDMQDSNTKYVDNKKLNTPYFKLIAHAKDGSNELKEQITDSVNRMKKARHGHSIDKIYEDHDYSFYLPKKTSYITKKQAKLMRLDSDNS